MLQESTRGNQTSLISPSSGDATARDRVYEEEQALIRRARASRTAAEAENFNRGTAYETRTGFADRVELAAAQRVNRIPIGTTLVEETAALYRWCLKNGERAGLVQHDSKLHVTVPGGEPRQIKTVEELRGLVLLVCAQGDSFQCPFVKYTVDKKGKRHATDAEPRPAAWRTLLAMPSYPGIRAWIAPGRDGGETTQQRALRLLSEAMEARQRWQVAADELASQLGVDRRQAEELVAQAGFRVRRPVTASGKPKLDPKTRRVMFQIER